MRRMGNFHFPYMKWNVLVLFAADQHLKTVKAKYDFIKAIINVSNELGAS